MPYRKPGKIRSMLNDAVSLFMLAVCMLIATKEERQEMASGRYLKTLDLDDPEAHDEIARAHSQEL